MGAATAIATFKKIVSVMAVIGGFYSATKGYFERNRICPEHHIDKICNGIAAIQTMLSKNNDHQMAAPN